jgi:hypothetical protein
MKSKVLTGLVVLLLAVITITMFIGYHNMVKREVVAASWSNSDFTFRATGHGNTTFMVYPYAYPDKQQLSCAVFIGEVVTDSKLSRELEDDGFSTIQCGDAKVDLP